MSRPPLEMADMVRCAGQSFLDRSRRWMTWQHQKVLLAIARCRTAALGGHRDQCSRCGHRAISYNSCRNRHCPKCQGNARHRWLQLLRPAPSAPVLESPDDPMLEVSEIEIPTMTIEPVPGAALTEPVILPCESSPKAVESRQLSLF